MLTSRPRFLILVLVFCLTALPAMAALALTHDLGLRHAASTATDCDPQHHHANSDAMLCQVMCWATPALLPTPLGVGSTGLREKLLPPVLRVPAQTYLWRILRPPRDAVI